MRLSSLLLLAVAVLFTAFSSSSSPSASFSLASAAAVKNKFFGWYGGIPAEIAGWSNAYMGDAWQVVPSYHQYGFKQQLIAIQGTFIEGFTNRNGKHALRLRPDWEHVLDENTALYRSLLSNGTAVGFMVGDELMWNGLSYANLTALTDALRTKFPSSFIWENEAMPTYSCDPKWETISCFDKNLDPIVITNGIPPGLNVTSVDIYSWWPALGPVQKMVRKYYENYLKPRLHPHQRLFVVPGADASNHNPLCNFSCYDDKCAQDASDFLQWIEEDPVIAGAMPWTWVSCGKGCIIDLDEIGCREMNKTKAAWERVGKKIMNLPLV